ncbi:hypothetical protein R5W24_004936 [Gemmata sp. JC717]|uniref:hypothetical protein n=1 Tax=Gemmata algarum TaxID=2975278 RepID=UPI0021BB1FFA|nr:hypothetical protein [Gemmata algarum]MDY3555790.1 hypothetical protein [Gemmata algarum]
MNDDAREEAERFRWIESEKAGYDLGEAAIQQWVARHWTAFVRGRALAHLTGRRFWLSMPREDFGALSRQFPHDRELIDEVTARLVDGADNLTLIQWAADTSRPLDRVCDILQRIDLNALRQRFPPPDDADPPHIVQG